MSLAKWLFPLVLLVACARGNDPAPNNTPPPSNPTPQNITSVEKCESGSGYDDCIAIIDDPKSVDADRAVRALPQYSVPFEKTLPSLMHRIIADDISADLQLVILVTIEKLDAKKIVFTQNYGYFRSNLKPELFQGFDQMVKKSIEGVTDVNDERIKGLKTNYSAALTYFTNNVPRGAEFIDAIEALLRAELLPKFLNELMNQAAADYAKVIAGIETMENAEFLKRATRFEHILWKGSELSFAFRPGQQGEDFKNLFAEIQKKYLGTPRLVLLVLLVRTYSDSIANDPTAIVPEEMFEATRWFVAIGNNPGEDRLGYFAFSAMIPMETRRLSKDSQRLLPYLYANYLSAFNNIVPAGNVPKNFVINLAAAAHSLCDTGRCNEVELPIEMNLFIQQMKEAPMFRDWVDALNDLLGLLLSDQKYAAQYSKMLVKYKDEYRAVLSAFHELVPGETVFIRQALELK